MCQDHRESREDEETRDILGREDCQVINEPFCSVQLIVTTDDEMSLMSR